MIQIGHSKSASQSNTIRLRRTLEYIPARSLSGVQARTQSFADVICFDLEDSVPPEEKASARDILCEAMSEFDFGEREVVVRINAYGTPEHEDDLTACVSSGVNGIVLPKVSNPQTLVSVRKIMGAHAIPLWPMIESPVALQQVDLIAREEGVSALVVGGYDLAESLGIARTRMRSLLHYYAPIVIAAKAAGISAIAPVAQDEVEDYAIGFDGRSCYFGQDIAAINEQFTPSDTDIQIAQNSLINGGIYGEHLEHARRLIRHAEVARARDRARNLS